MNKVLIATFMASAIAFAGWYWSHSTSLQLQTELNQLQAALASKQLESDGLAAELMLSEQMLQSMLFDRQTYERLLKNYESKIAHLRHDSEQLSQHIAKLRVSTNEETRNWSNTAVPADAQRLLQQALRSANGHSQQNPADFATGKPAVGVPSQEF